MNGHRSSPTKHSHRGNHAYQSETMITMEVRDENIVNLVIVQLGVSKLQLSAFAAIDHKEFISHIQNLRGW